MLGALPAAWRRQGRGDRGGRLLLRQHGGGRRLRAGLRHHPDRAPRRCAVGHAARAARGGLVACCFPEGTRSPDGRIGRFRPARPRWPAPRRPGRADRHPRLVRRDAARPRLAGARPAARSACGSAGRCGRGRRGSAGVHPADRDRRSVGCSPRTPAPGGSRCGARARRRRSAGPRWRRVWAATEHPSTTEGRLS